MSREIAENDRPSGLIRFVGPLLIGLALAHGVTAVTTVMFRSGLAATLHDGFFNAADRSADREAAFWFILFAPVLAVVGLLLSHAVSSRERYTEAILGWTLFSISVVGACAMFASGFWVGIALSLPVLADVHWKARATTEEPLLRH